MATNGPVTGGTPITIKISIGEEVKKLKLPLKDLTAEVLPARLIAVLALPTDKKVIFERFSDSAGSFITLDSANPAVYKTLVRAAKAKLKLRLRALVEGEPLVHAPLPSREPTLLTGLEPKLISADIMSRPEIAAALSKLPQANDRKEISQAILKSKNVRAPLSASGRNNIGAGIFEFKDALSVLPRQPRSDVSQGKTLKHEVPVSFLDAYGTDIKSFKSQCEPMLVYRRKTSADGSTAPRPTWSVYCNVCDATLNNEHFHCSICDGGDYDLCQSCVDAGKLCPGVGHWLVKRSVKDGMIISSTTERLPPKAKMSAEIAPPSIPCTLPLRPHWNPPKPENSVPGAFADDARTLREESFPSTRTCNSCIDVMNDDQFVTCVACEDFDLCLKCHSDNKHGHHPGHGFTPACESQRLNKAQETLLAPGRGVHHMAICDGCDKSIVGVRHKCFDCPDFDYCNNCIRAAALTHPGHRFAPLHEPIALSNRFSSVVHQGVYCDGPACCSNPRQAFITGIRYKCVVCNDTDFCASCEAQPNSAHNKTHPLIKITSPIRGLSISTVNDMGNGNVVSSLGDRRPESVAPLVPCPYSTLQAPMPATVPVPAPVPAPIPAKMPVLSSASSVKTVAVVEPSPAIEAAAKDTKVVKQEFVPVDESRLQGLFVCDTIPDGITVRGDTRFTQVWTMRNPGPCAWPAGCSVRLVGGDNMLNVDRERPFSAAAMGEATESNVIAREVLPGEEVSFKVILKAPNRNGKAISYWRLKTADGTPFGHRLWCDINVRAWEDMNGPAASCGAAKMQGLQPKVDSPKVEIEKPAAPAEVTVPEASESTMVYPTLEKESPASSVHQLSRSDEGRQATPRAAEKGSAHEIAEAKAATVEDEATGDVISASMSKVSDEDEQEDMFEDIDGELDVLSASGEGSDDDGFLTDEEYDILDASDQETIASSD